MSLSVNSTRQFALPSTKLKYRRSLVNYMNRKGKYNQHAHESSNVKWYLYLIIESTVRNYPNDSNNKERAKSSKIIIR